MSNLKQQVEALLQEAQEKKKTSTPDAIKLLEQAAQLLPHLPPDNDKRSERNMTQDRGTQDILYLSKRGNIYYELKNYQEAADCYKAIKDVLPNNTRVYKAYGDCFRKQNKYEEAIKEYGQGLLVFKRDEASMPVQQAELLNSRGLAYLGMKDFKQALADFDGAVKISAKNPLYHCNKGQAAYGSGDKTTALTHFKKANELVKSNQLGDLTRHNLGYIEKTLNEFIDELEALSKISLSRSDMIMDAREVHFVGNTVESLSGPTAAEEEAPAEKTIKDLGSQLRDAKQNLNLILEDQQLYEYYDGFMFTLHQSYATAVIVNSGQLVINTSDTKLDLIIKAVSLVPLVGSQVSGGLKSVKDFVKGAETTKAASNVCKFSTTAIQFDEMTQDILCQVILEKKDTIKALKEADLNATHLPSWAQRFQGVVNKIKELGSQVDRYLYGERNETPLQKFGYQTASTLVSDYIANGEIYEGVPAVRVSPADKSHKLASVTRKVIDQSLQPKDHSEAPKQPVQITDRSGCCEMF